MQLQDKLSDVQLDCNDSTALEVLHARLATSVLIRDLVDLTTRSNGKQVGVKFNQKLSSWLMDRRVLSTEIFADLQ